MNISSPRRPAASGTDQNDALPSLRNGVRDDVRELRLLFELSQLLDCAAHIGETLDGALCLMARHMAMMRGSISLVSPGDGSIHIESSYGLNAAEQARGHYAAGEGVTGTVIRTGRPMVISNVSDDPLFLNRTRSRNLRKDAVSFICVPIRADDQAIGALSVDRLFADTSTLEEDARLLTIIASMLARAAKVRRNCLPERDAGRTAARRHDRGRVSLRSPFFVGSCEAMQQVYARIDQVARSSATVLLRGESGTGKELAALAIHAASPRANRPFITLNCAALPEALVENELFGHERGAFTGAQGLYRGRFEQADGGTLFLDEGGDLPPLTQAKLLRVIQERSYERRRGNPPRGRAPDHRHQPAAGRYGASGNIPGRPLLSPERLSHRTASAPRSQRGHRPAGGSLHEKVRGGGRTDGNAPFPQRGGHAPALRMARQYPRTGKHYGAGRTAGRRGGRHSAPASAPGAAQQGLPDFRSRPTAGRRSATPRLDRISHSRPSTCSSRRR